MKLRDFSEQLRRLDQDTDVKIRVLENDREEERGFSYEDPIVEVGMLKLGAGKVGSERRVVCIR